MWDTLSDGYGFSNREFAYILQNLESINLHFAFGLKH